MRFIKFISTFFNSKGSTADQRDLKEKTAHNWDVKFNDLGIFTYNDLGFDLESEDGTHSIKWTDIERLEAYKVDRLTTDEIRLNIVSNNKSLTITEETKGWYQFVERVKSALPLVDGSWEFAVAQTPYETNLTTIYERPDRKMPSESNFFSIIKGATSDEVSDVFQKQGWTVRKSSFTDFEFQNSWSELVLESDKGDLLLHGLVAHHPDNVSVIKQLLADLKCVYRFEFYDQGELVEQGESSNI